MKKIQQHSDEDRADIQQSDKQSVQIQKVKFVTFRYPLFFADRDRFETLDEIQQLFKNQKCVEYPEAQRLFKITKRGIYIYFSCKKCEAKVSMIQCDKSFFKVNRCDIDHKHVMKYHSKQQIEQYFCDNRARFGELKFREEVKRKFKIQDRKYYYLMKKTEQNYHNFHALDEYLQKNNFSFKMDWKRQTEQYPNFIVAASKQMLSNYQNYGEYIYFDTFTEILKNYNDQIIGIFSGQNSKRKPMIFGICTFSKEDKNTYLKIFTQFFNLIQNYPKAIITKQDQILNDALIQLKQTTNFNGIHLLNVDYLLEDTQSLIKNLPVNNRPPNWTNIFMNKLKLIIRERSFTQGKKLLTEFVQQISNEPEIDAILQNFIEKLHQICFWRIPQIFVGLSRFPNESSGKICDLINEKVSKKSIKFNLNRAIQVIHNLSHELTSKSNLNFSITDSQMQNFYKDHKLKPTRLKVQNKVYLVFFENYIEARQLNFIKDIVKKQYLIENKMTKQTYTVENWKCSCSFNQKTGIPCSHIITIIYKEGINKQYHQLFHKRWIKTFNDIQPEQNLIIEERLEKGKNTSIKMKNKYNTD